MLINSNKCRSIPAHLVYVFRYTLTGIAGLIRVNCLNVMTQILSFSCQTCSEQSSPKENYVMIHILAHDPRTVINNDAPLYYFWMHSLLKVKGIGKAIVWSWIPILVQSANVILTRMWDVLSYLSYLTSWSSCVLHSIMWSRWRVTAKLIRSCLL